MAVCHEPVAVATWNATTAFSPMPGASAMGKLAASPISSVQTAAAAAVAAAAASNGTPAAPRIEGFANRMYAIVRKVAMAPRSSRATVGTACVEVETHWRAECSRWLSRVQVRPIACVMNAVAFDGGDAACVRECRATVATRVAPSGSPRCRSLERA